MTTLKRLTQARIPTSIGEFDLHLYDSPDDKDHLAITMGDLTNKEGILARVHSECFTGDVLGSRRCDCGPQLNLAMQMVAEAGEGVIIYLRQEGRGIGLLDKLRAYNLQDEGYDTVDANLLLGHEADERDYTVAALILADLSVQSVRLMTNNPAKIEALGELGIDVIERVPLKTDVHTDNLSYLQTKLKRMNHLFDAEDFLSAEPSRDNFDRPA